MKVGNSASLCFLRAKQKDYGILLAIKDFDCLAVYYGIPIINDSYTYGTIRYGGKPVSGTAKQMVARQDWNSKCPTYLTKITQLISSKLWEESNSYYFPLSVDEAKKCIDEGKTSLDFYDASCPVINKIKLKDEGNYDEKGIVDSADITAIKSDPATFWTYVQNDLTQLNNYIQKMVGNWG